MGCVLSCGTPPSPDASPARAYATPRLVTQLVDLGVIPVENSQEREEEEEEEEEEEGIYRGVPDGREGGISACSVRTVQSLLDREQERRKRSGGHCTLHVPNQSSIDSEVTVLSEWSLCSTSGNDWRAEGGHTTTKTDKDNDYDNLRASSLTRQETGGKILLY